MVAHLTLLFNIVIDKMFLFVLVLLVCGSTIHGQTQNESKISLFIEANNHTYLIPVNDLDDIPVPFYVTIKGFKPNYNQFVFNHSYGSDQRNLDIDLGHILNGKKVDICVYFSSDERPSCDHILIKPLPIRSPWCSSGNDSINYTFLLPEFGYYDYFIVWLVKTNGEHMPQKLSRQSNAVNFTGLEPDTEYGIYTETHAGQENLPNTIVSDSVVCYTLSSRIDQGRETDDTGHISRGLAKVNIILVAIGFLVICCIIWFIICLIMKLIEDTHHSRDTEQENNLLKDEFNSTIGHFNVIVDEE